MTPADAQQTSDQYAGARPGAGARKVLGKDPGATLITLAAFLVFVLSVADAVRRGRACRSQSRELVEALWKQQTAANRSSHVRPIARRAV